MTILDAIDYLDSDQFDFHNPLDHQLYYHITNQTAAGGCAEFPVVTDATLNDLRVTKCFADGSTVDVALFDSDGVLSDVLDTCGVFLDSLDDPLFHSSPVRKISISGILVPNLLEVQTEPGGSIHVVRIAAEFQMDLHDPRPGVFSTITVTDRENNRYTIGTFGIAVMG